MTLSPRNTRRKFRNVWSVRADDDSSSISSMGRLHFVVVSATPKAFRLITSMSVKTIKSKHRPIPIPRADSNAATIAFDIISLTVVFGEDPPACTIAMVGSWWIENTLFKRHIQSLQQQYGVCNSAIYDLQTCNLQVANICRSHSSTHYPNTHPQYTNK